MGRWLLNAFPTWALALLCVLVPMAATFLAAKLLTRLAPAAAEGRYSAAAHNLLTQAMVLYGFVLAFTIVNQYQDVSSARNDVQVEALNLEDLYRVSTALPEPARSELGAAVRSYDLHVVRDEWDQLAHGRSDPGAATELKRMYEVVQAPVTVTARPSAVGADLGGHALDYLHTVHEARHRRIDTAAQSMPGVLVVFLVVGAVGVLVSSLLLGIGGHRLITPLGLAALLGFTLYLSLTLEHPFSGDHPIPSTHFQEGTLAQFVAAP
ncbi:MAG: DUF4239 domain-containing protein [Actinomycetota bacterium]|nr:DUF4239 domain-containing protein [Actinomycetota bacterium]